jgi:HD-GYP domain-containing protein (c-di-GMP phosphodiesterase class II)
MASNARRIDAAKADYLDPALYEDDAAPGLPALTRGHLLTSLSRAFDLAEGRRPGHAERVAYIGVSLAEAVGVLDEVREHVLFACLLHDVGMGAAAVPPRPRRSRRAAAAAGVSPITAAEWASVLQSITAHCETGAQVARDLGLGEDVAGAVANHHDCWDGTGVPGALSGERLPLVARIVAVADRLESMIDSDGSPLQIRTNGRRSLLEMAGNELDPKLAGVMAELTSQDGFWFGLYDSDSPGWLATTDAGPELQGHTLFGFIGVISDLVDRRNGREPGRARKVAGMAERLAAICDMSPQRAEMVGLAALLQDIGTLGVPARFLNKPDILTVEEMAAVQYHPTHARELLSEIPGFGRISWWVGCHHERIDGKGYPAMLEGDEVPLEAQIIGICDAFEALTSDRPHRKAISQDDALQVVRGLAGSRFEPFLVDTFEASLSVLASG